MVPNGVPMRMLHMQQLRGPARRLGRVAVVVSLLVQAVTSPGGISATEVTNEEPARAALAVLKLSDGEVQPALKWAFSVADGADGHVGAALATDTSEADQDGLLDFDGLELEPDSAYSVCQTDVPAGWSSHWRIDSDRNGVADTIVVPGNPDAGDQPPQDVGQRCLAIGQGSAYPLVGGVTLLLEVDNWAPGGDPRGPGFWKNWSSCTAGAQYELAERNGGATAGWFVLDDILSGPGISWGDFNIVGCQLGVAVLDQRDGLTDKKRASDAAYTVAMQLLAAQLNFAAGAATCSDAQEAALEAEALLVANEFDGAGAYLRPKDDDHGRAVELAAALGRYNLGDLCVAEPPQVSTVSGTVTDATTGIGLADAAVSIDDGAWTATTDAVGSYQIVDVVDGSRSISASQAGYQPLNETIVVDGDTSWDAALEPDVVPPQASTVSGTVTDIATGLGLADATVSIDDGTWIATTDADGMYQIADVEHGSQTISASAVGYQPLTETISVDGDTTWNATLEVDEGGDPPGGEPGPEPVPSAIDPTVLQPFSSSVAFLYEGADAVQTGVAEGAMDERRVSVVRGVVTDRDGDPLPGTQISVLRHGELGQVLTRVDGRFDIAINGGGPVTVVAALDGYLPAHRQSVVPWNDYLTLDPIRLVALSPSVTRIDLSGAGSAVARGDVETDDDGTRQGTLIFQPGTLAEMELPDGSRQPFSNLSVRITEFTVGPNGPEAMPALLPPTSGYTYAAEYSIDEAIAAGAVSVHFEPAAVSYTDDFIGFPVGTSVPTGSYDRAAGAWKPSSDGTVLEVIGATGGLADVDLDGDGLADDPATIGMTDPERAELATLYSSGARLWRVPIPHFSPWDHNWPFGPPPGADGPRPEHGPDDGGPRPDDPCQRSGSSTIECQSQVLREDIPLAGTDQSLHYRSDRAEKYTAGRSLRVAIPEGEIPDIATSVRITLAIAGTEDSRTFPSFQDVDTTFQWDGKDAYGRTLFGAHTYTLKIGFVYEAFYAQASGGGAGGGGDGGASFALQPGVLLEGSRAREEIILSRTFVGHLDALLPELAGIGHWTLSDHHLYASDSGSLFEGWGDIRREASGIKSLATDQLSCQTACSFPSEGAAITDTLFRPADIAVLPDGSILAALAAEHEVWRVTPEGTITRFAGTGSSGNSGDGGFAVDAQIANPVSLAVLPDGSVLIAHRGNPGAPLGERFHVVRRVDADGTISTVLGGGTVDYSDNLGLVLPATSLYVGFVRDVAAGADGSFYAILWEEFATTRTIWHVSPDGTAQRIAGVGTGSTSSGDGGPAVDAQINAVSLIVADDGTVFFAEGSEHRVRNVSGGIVDTIAGTGACSGPNDGGPATSTQLCSPESLELGPDDSLLIATSNERIYRLDGNRLQLYAGGGGSFDFYEEGVFALGIRLGDIATLDYHPDGSLIYSATTSLRRLTPALFGRRGEDLTAVPSRDGRHAYLFDQAGLHLETVDTFTGGTVRTFTYDAAGLLARITDAAGLTTVVERDAAGTPTAVVGPRGRRTELTIVGGRLTGMTGPGGDAYAFTYGLGGALAQITDPRGHSSSYEYDTEGRLVRAVSRGGGMTTLLRTSLALGAYEIAVTTRGTDTTTYRVEPDGLGVRRSVVDPTGATTNVVLGADGLVTGTFPDGSVATYELGADPRFGLGVVHVAASTWTSPGSISSTSSLDTAVALEVPSDPSSLQTWTETLTQDGRIATTAYDVATRTMTRTSPEGRVATVSLDEAGRVVSESFANGVAPITYGYDADGRLASMSQASEVLTFTYDADGDLVSATDDDGGTWAWTHDAAGRTTSVTLPGGATYTYELDANGNRTAIITPNGATHTLAYDANDEVLSYAAPGSATTTWDLDGLARREGVSYPDASDRDDLYQNDQFVGSVLPDATIDIAYAAAATGIGTTTNVESLTRTPSGGTGQAIDLNLDGNLVTGLSMAGPATASVGWTYAVPYRAASRALNAEAPIAFGYDLDGLLTAIGPFTIARSATTGLPASISDGTLLSSLGFDDRAQLVSRGIEVSGVEAYGMTLSYDASGRILARSENVDGNVIERTYVYDADGRLERVDDGSGVTVETFGYDGNGNRTSSPSGSAAYDLADRLVSRAGIAYGYDANGFLSSRGGDSFDYSVDGALVRATVDGASVSYTDDAYGRRVARTGDGGTTAYVYADTDHPFRVTGSFAPDGTVSEYLYDDAGALFALRRAASWFYVGVDHVGSPRAVVEAATGAVVKTVEFGAFGEVLADSAPGFELAVGFAGGLPDPDTDLVRFGWRDYEPASGRWTGADPIVYAGRSLNLYEYVGSDPVNAIDPAGLLTVGGSFYAGFGGGIELTITRQGFAVCTEGGVGAGGGVGLNLASSELPDAVTSAVFEAGIGPISGGLEVPFDDCWASGRGLNVNVSGPPLDPRGLLPSTDGGPPTDRVKGGAKPKLGLQAKLAVKGCAPFAW